MACCRRSACPYPSSPGRSSVTARTFTRQALVTGAVPSVPLTGRLPQRRQLPLDSVGVHGECLAGSESLKFLRVHGFLHLRSSQSRLSDWMGPHEPAS